MHLGQMIEITIMRVNFFGAGEFGLPTLKWLQQQYEVGLVVTQPDKPAGRKRELTPTPVAQWAMQAGLPVQRCEDVNTEAFVQRLQAVGAEATVVIAFGQKLSPQVIAAGGKLVINLHASLLPKYRGAAPINWAIIRGETETGLSVIGLAQRMDAGIVYAQVRTAIDPLETAGELHDRLSLLGPQAVGQVLTDYQKGTLQGLAQEERQATKAPKLSKEDGVVDWTRSAREVVARIHGLTPWPGVRVCWHHGADDTKQELLLRRAKWVESGHAKGAAEPGRVLEAGVVAAGRGAVKLLEVQKPGGRVLTIEEFLRGHDFCAGDRLMAMDGASV